MKIINISSYFLPHAGGLETVSKEIALGIAKKGHHVEVFTSDIGCPKDKQLKSTKNLKINYLPAWEFAHTAIIPSLFSKLMKTSKDSIIHIHSSSAFVPEIVWLVSKLRGLKYIAHLHGSVEPTGYLGFLLYPYQKIIFKTFLKSASKIIVLSKGYGQFFKKRYKLKIEPIVVPNGVGRTFFLNKKEKHKDIHLLYVGRLSKEKNITILIEAISLMKYKDIQLNIVGEGEKRKDIENLIKEKKLKNVILYGRKEGKELLNFYKKADIFLLASESEGFPLVLLEAMATKTPIIASDVKGNHEVVKNVGILVNPPTPKDFAEAIEKLIKNSKLRKKLARNGLKEVKKYSWDKIIKKIEEVYCGVLTENKKNK